MENGFYVMTFHSTAHSIQTEKLAKERFKIVTMPTPTEISANCGLALKFSEVNKKELFLFLDTLKIPYDLYKLSNEKINGRRQAEKIDLTIEKEAEG